jgi:hypothetical protein
MKVIKIDDGIYFDDGTVLASDHQQECCESHYLSFSDIKLDDFEGLEFDLNSDNFFNRVEDYGIELIPINGRPVRIPGYASNNGSYSSNLSLVLYGTINKDFDISDCQPWDY